MAKSVRIVSSADELDEGLFGQVILYIFELLPYLAQRNAKPEWKVHALRYGGQDETVIPGVVDLNYDPEPVSRDVSLSKLRRRHCYQLGNDWGELHRLWTSYFSIPLAIRQMAESVGVSSDTLGVHYRGTDKLTANWDTNPVTANEMILIVKDMLERRPHLKRVFVATDDNKFARHLKLSLSMNVVNLGQVAFHKGKEHNKNIESAKRAMLDSFVLSQCGAVLKTSSALSGFAKVLNPDLEIYRCSASKKFADIPYFPVAYIPPYQADSPQVKEIVSRLMNDDWQRSIRKPMKKFSYRPRSRRRALKWSIVEAITGSLVD